MWGEGELRALWRDIWRGAGVVGCRIVQWDRAGAQGDMGWHSTHTGPQISVQDRIMGGRSTPFAAGIRDPRSAHPTEVLWVRPLLPQPPAGSAPPFPLPDAFRSQT